MSAAIARQLKKNQLKNSRERKKLKPFAHDDPMLRARKEMHQVLLKAEIYRISLLKKITTFSGLSSDELRSAAQNMEEIYMVKGDVVIQQDDVGDSFFILEEGMVSITRKINMRDPNETPKELTRLGKNCHFGEISLLTEELRSATVTICSEHAKVLKMTKDKFDLVMSAANQIDSEVRSKIGKDVVDKVPLFKSLSSMNKKQVLDTMKPMQFLPASYICRQGKLGNTFYIITEGQCRVTINLEDGSEKDVAKLYVGDFFGEVALIDPASKRTANVISDGHVTCMTLCRSEFHVLLKGIEVVLMEHQAVRGAAAIKKKSTNNSRRRLSSLDNLGHRSEIRVVTLLKRMSKYMSESFWNSLYSRMHRVMLLNPARADEFGTQASNIMKEGLSGLDTVELIMSTAVRILRTEVSRRSADDNSFIMGLMKHKNYFRTKLCAGWAEYQITELCKKLRFINVKSMRRIIECDTRGTCAFVIARGCVRVFSQVINEVNGKRSMEYEEDLFPGEIFGEAALGGVHHRYITVQAITDVDLILVEDEDYMAIQDRGVSKMSVDERFRYIQEVPVFKNWEPYRLYRVAHALQQDELEKGVVAMRKGEPNKDWKFVVGGKLDIVSSLKDPSVITSVQVHDYFGESGLLNKAEKDKFAPQIVESCYAVAATKVEILTLTEANFNQIITYRGCIDSIRSAFMAKKAWRQSRSIQLKHEKNRVKDLKSKLMHTANEDSEAARALGITISSPTCTSPMTATVTRTATKTATGTGSRAATRTDGHISPVNTCTFTDTLTHTGTSSAEHIRPVSPGGLVAKVTSTFTPNDNEVNAFVKVTEHLTTNEYGLIDVDDIPEAMDVPYDPLVMTGTCRNERERLKMASRITDRFRPASASGMKKSMTNRGSTVRPSSAGVTSARPKSANATATQHASKPKFSDDTMDPKPALQRPSTAGAIRSGTSTGKLNSLLPPRSANVISRPISGVDPRFQRDDKERTAAMGAGIGNKMENIQVSRSTPFLYTNKNYNNEGLKVTNPVTRDAKLHPNAKYMHLPVVTVATYNTAPFRNDSTNNPAVRTQTGFVGYGRPNSPKLVGTASIPNQQTFGDFKRTHNM